MGLVENSTRFECVFSGDFVNEVKKRLVLGNPDLKKNIVNKIKNTENNNTAESIEATTKVDIPVFLYFMFPW